MRTVKLFLASVLTILLCIAVTYVTEPHLPYWIYRCLVGADSKVACLRGQPTTFRTTTLGTIYEGTTEDYIDRRVLFFGAFEKAELFFLRDVSAGGVFVDIGAHKGLYSLFMSKYQKEIHAFEPFPPVLSEFKKLVTINNAKNILVHPVGLGEKHERLPFETPGSNNMAMGSFAFLSGGKAHDYFEIVPGDQALKNSGVTAVDLIKMDIEGFERPALRGLVETLKHSRPIVLFELTVRANDAKLFRSMAEIADAFPGGYKFLVIKNLDPYTGAYQMVPAERVVKFGKTQEQHNVVAFPVEKENRIPLKGPVRTE